MSVTVKFDYRKVINGLKGMESDAKKVDRFTTNDMRRRIPGIVAKGTAAAYQVGKREVEMMAKRRNKAGGLSIRSGGHKISNLEVYFIGPVHSNWPVTPKSPSKKRKNKKQAPYTVRQTIRRKQPAIVKTKNGYRAYVITGRNRVFIVGEDNKPLIKAGTSIPQAIRSKESMKLWQPELNKQLEERFFHNFQRIVMKK